MAKKIQKYLLVEKLSYTWGTGRTLVVKDTPKARKKYKGKILRYNIDNKGNPI